VTMKNKRQLSTSERRMTENQAYFRKKNEQVLKGFENIRKIAAEDGVEPILEIPITPLQFICECSDSECGKRIPLKIEEWSKIHSKPDTFVVYPGHIVSSIETEVERRESYSIVKKYVVPELPGDRLYKVKVSFKE
jgi:hypothetical protein